MKFATIREAAEEWVGRFNAYPEEMIKQLMEVNPQYWYEVTPPAAGDEVYVYSGRYTGAGEIVRYLEDEDKYLIKMDEDDKRHKIDKNDFEVEHDDFLPMWGTMWQFDDSIDDWWLESCGGLQIMADCGFRVYESDEFGYFFGIDGCGYDFYEAHWIPLYKARGLQWHTEAEDQEVAAC